jgi:transcriptional regulator with XRE-family HTH domain
MGNVRRRPERLGEKLRQIRESLELSQSEMLRRLEAEDLITYPQISEYESGKRDHLYKFSCSTHVRRVFVLR